MVERHMARPAAMLFADRAEVTRWRAPFPSQKESRTLKFILDSAKAYAAGKGYRFGPGADDYMRQHATNAGTQIDALPKSKQTTKLKKAVNNFATLVDEMIKEAHTIPGYENAHPGSIGEDTGRSAEALGTVT